MCPLSSIIPSLDDKLNIWVPVYKRLNSYNYIPVGFFDVGGRLGGPGIITGKNEFKHFLIYI